VIDVKSHSRWESSSQEAFLNNEKLLCTDIIVSCILRKVPARILVRHRQVVRTEFRVLPHRIDSQLGKQTGRMDGQVR
jgi:hypothetical protein